MGYTSYHETLDLLQTEAEGALAMPELTVPSNIEDLTQDLYSKYIKQVKAMLLQSNYKQFLLTPENLSNGDDYDIVSIPQTNGGYLVQLRAKTGTLTAIFAQVAELSPTDFQLLKSYINS